MPYSLHRHGRVLATSRVEHHVLALSGKSGDVIVDDETGRRLWAWNGLRWDRVVDDASTKASMAMPEKSGPP